MKGELERRDFLKLGTTLGATTLLKGRRTLLMASPPLATGDTYLKKSLKFTMVKADGLSVLWEVSTDQGSWLSRCRDGQPQ